MEELKLYTIKDLKDWVLDGHPPTGLSEAVITPTRAYSFINNPYVTDNMVVASALFVGEELAAFTAAFPERLAKPDCTTHWINSLYVSPKHEGKGYALFVLGSLCECYENDPVFDLDAVDTSVEILKYLGLGTKTFTRFSFREKVVLTKSLKGKTICFIESHKRERRIKRANKRLYEEMQGIEYRYSYENYVDKEAYDFMMAHSVDDMFLRRRESLNWMLHFPFVHETPIMGKTLRENLFSSSKRSQRYYVIKLFVKDVLAAVYIFRDSSSALSLDYLYYDAMQEHLVFLSIVEHLLCIGNPKFTTTNSKVADLVNKFKIYPICSEEQPSLCFDKMFGKDAELCIQGGDGDMFLN